ncbi:MAG: RsmB/NOP family class I SAM-dependent RNA methyltransferase [Flavobacteriaceae bacterium]
MKLHRNIALGIVEGLQQLLEEKQNLRTVLNQLLKKNRKWGSRDRRLLGEVLLDCVRWKRTYMELGGLHSSSVHFFWELMGVWILSKKHPLPYWIEFENLQQLSTPLVLNPKKRNRAITESIPDWLDQMGADELGLDFWEKEIKTLNSTSPLVIRANSLKTQTIKLQLQLQQEFKIECQTLQDFPEALLLDKHQKVTHLEPYQKGLFEVQDANSQRVAHWVNPRKGKKIIDACAGAGGKTLHLAALMQNQGILIAADTYPKKLEQLRKRVQRNGVTIVTTQDANRDSFFDQEFQQADAVLIDAPCSGLGVLRRNPAAKWHLNSDRIDELKKLQQYILKRNAPLVKQGGTLVYATCSILPSENQKQVQTFLSSAEGSRFQLEKQQTFWTHETGFDGFYIAKMKAQTVNK